MRWSAQPPHLLPLLLFTTVLNSVQHALSERLLAACGSVPSDRAILQPAATVGARRRSVFDRTCALILTASFETSVLPDQAPGAVTVVDESLCRPSVLRAVPRRPVVHETRAPCRPPGRRPEQAAAALPGGEAGGATADAMPNGARDDCSTCAKAAHGAAECEACRDAARARYDARRAAGVCVKYRTRPPSAARPTVLEDAAYIEHVGDNRHPPQRSGPSAYGQHPRQRRT